MKPKTKTPVYKKYLCINCGRIFIGTSDGEMLCNNCNATQNETTTQKEYKHHGTKH